MNKYLGSSFDDFMEEMEQKEKERSKWISVKDELPPHFDYVFIYGENPDESTIASSLHSIGRLECDKQDEVTKDWTYKWCILDDANIGAFSDMGFFEFKPEWITHWMPLPEMPVAEKEEKE